MRAPSGRSRHRKLTSENGRALSHAGQTGTRRVDPLLIKPYALVINVQQQSVVLYVDTDGGVPYPGVTGDVRERLLNNAVRCDFQFRARAFAVEADMRQC